MLHGPHLHVMEDAAGGHGGDHRELHPGVPLNVVRENCLHAAVVQVLSHLLQLWAVLLRGAGTKNDPEDIAAHVDHAGGFDLSGNVHAAVGDQRLGQLGLHGPAGTHHIQNGDYNGFRAAQALQRGQDTLQGVALHADKDHVGLLVVGLLFKYRDGNGKGAVAGLQHQTIFFYGVPVGTPGDEGDVLFAHGQKGGQTASGAAGAIYKVLHKSLQAAYDLSQYTTAKRPDATQPIREKKN